MPNASTKRRLTKVAKGAKPAAPRAPAQDSVVHTSLYVNASAFDALREIAFNQRRRIHDVVMDGVDLVLVKHGYQPTERRKRGPKSAS